MPFTTADIKVFVDEFLNGLSQEDFEHEAINWGDLKCIDVVIQPQEIAVWIEECSPDCVDLSIAVQDAVMAEFERDTIVHCEW